jgi:hypothetical protein
VIHLQLIPKFLPIKNKAVFQPFFRSNTASNV